MMNRWISFRHPGLAFCVLLAATAVFVAPGTGRAQDGFVFGADNQGKPIETPGFGVAGKRAASDRPAPGTAGTGDYSRFLGRLSIVQPEENNGGLWTVFRMTRLLCNSLYQGRVSITEAAPEGFVIERSDVHMLGFAGKHWKEDRYAITVTGDSEKDAAGGHPFWEIKYDEAGRLTSCGVTLGPGLDRQEDMSAEDQRARAIQLMYIGVPQLFSAILVEPRFAGTYPLAPSEVVELAAPCDGGWCRISTIYDFRPGTWHVMSTIRFNLPPAAD